MVSNIVSACPSAIRKTATMMMWSTRPSPVERLLQHVDAIAAFSKQQKHSNTPICRLAP
jgi:hypothetical protein